MDIEQATSCIYEIQEIIKNLQRQISELEKKFSAHALFSGDEHE